ncbi:hypothetical protein G7046_g9002 [Stylonectria norvegica]|nr:hypothetical protein G7046_g9002 [Stylonectria norvegica]
MAENTFIHVNYVPSEPLAVISNGIPALRLLAPPKSDIYASPGPPQLHVFTAPVTCTRIKKSSFSLARVTVSARWMLQFDQGGLIFEIPTAGDADASTAKTFHPAWIKIGIEMNNGAPYVSIVGKPKNGWCDWSLVPVDGKLGEEVSTTLELTRVKNALMVWMINGEAKVLIRKVPWVFLDDPELSEDVLLGLYAACPDPDDASGGKNLDVKFTDFSFEII